MFGQNNMNKEWQLPLPCTVHTKGISGQKHRDEGKTSGWQCTCEKRPLHYSVPSMIPGELLYFVTFPGRPIYMSLYLSLDFKLSETGLHFTLSIYLSIPIPGQPCISSSINSYCIITPDWKRLYDSAVWWVGVL